jgi:phosphohistidine phosphatase
MLLYIVRHAWAEERDAERYPNDDHRPLTGEGKKRFAKMVEHLVDGGFRPTLIATSPLVRCRQTADLIVKHSPDAAKIVELDALRPGSDLNALMDWTAGQPDQAIAWVGHAPDVGDLAASLIGDPGAAIRFAKGAVAAIEFDGEPAGGTGELNWLATAKLLGC